MDEFNLKQFLVENKLTTNSKSAKYKKGLNEALVSREGAKGIGNGIKIIKNFNSTDFEKIKTPGLFKEMMDKIMGGFSQAFRDNEDNQLSDALDQLKYLKDGYFKHYKAQYVDQSTRGGQGSHKVTTGTSRRSGVGSQAVAKKIPKSIRENERLYTMVKATGENFLPVHNANTFLELLTGNNKTKGIFDLLPPEFTGSDDFKTSL